MEPGDAMIHLYNTPHTPTRNEGTEDRMNIFFRLRQPKRACPFGALNLTRPIRFPGAKSRHPNHTHDGSSVLTERSPGGKYLPWGPGDEPFEKSKAALCDMWAEWEGMQGIVAQEKGPWPGIWLDNAAWKFGSARAATRLGLSLWPRL